MDSTFIEVTRTDARPWNFGAPYPPTRQGNYLVTVAHAQKEATFLVGLKEEGWFVVLPTPLRGQDDPEEWCYDWMWPYQSREEAMTYVSGAWCRHMRNVVKAANEGYLAADDIFKNNAWIADAPEHTVKPELRVVH